MKKIPQEVEELLKKRFEKDSILALATTVGTTPYVRSVDAYYKEGAFYVLTHALSNKMKQIEVNPVVALAGEWFTGHGKGVNLGYFGNPENADIAVKMREVFSDWIDNGHNNFDDVNTCILKIELTDAVLFSQGKRYEF